MEVEVRVLGPVEVHGAARPLRRCGALDLVVYLAMHPSGAPTEQWATALWPEREMSPATLWSTASAARRGLGASRAGAEHLPCRRRRLQLAATVGSDVEHFSRLAASDDKWSWWEALRLIRGRPFEGLRSPDWPVLEGLTAEIEESVVEVAERVAHAEMVSGDGASAARAARCGLRAAPFDERLYRVLLRAADLLGNRVALDSMMAQFVSVLSDGLSGGLPDGAASAFTSLAPARSRRVTASSAGRLHPATVALYRSLRGEDGEALAR